MKTLVLIELDPASTPDALVEVQRVVNGMDAAATGPLLGTYALIEGDAEAVLGDLPTYAEGHVVAQPDGTTIVSVPAPA